MGAPSPYYTLFPATGATTASLVGNTVYTMSVKGGIFGTCFIRGWIDYNQDGVFTATETIGISPNVGASTSGVIVFTVPLNAINGATRMRLRSSDIPPGPGTGDFCGVTNSTFGETEDYVITVAGATAQFTYVWSPATFLTSTTANPTSALAVTATTNYNCIVSAPSGCVATGSIPVTVNPIIVNNPATTTGISGTFFNQTFTQSGAVGGAIFTLNTGTLPTGLTLSAAGVLSGTPTQTGSFSITVRVTAGNGCIGTGTTYTLVISGSSTITVNLKLFLQGYYIGGSFMQTVLNNQTVLNSLSNETDTITVELQDQSLFTLVDSKQAVLLTNGTVSATFTQPPGLYFIAIKHRNSIQTWSANPVSCPTLTPFDFTSAANQAMGNNMVEVQPGIWAIFTGDINQDDFIDGNDFPAFDTDSFNGINSVYVSTDMNGDGFVDGNDFPVFDVNSFNGVSAVHP